MYGLGIPRDRVELLDNGAARETVVAALKRAAERTGSGGKVWFYFAGHGAASPTTGERILLGDDVRAQLESFEPRAVSVSEVEKLAGKRGADVMMLLDTCFTGQGRSGADLLDGKRFAMPSYAVRKGGGGLEWVATGPNQWSAPFHEVKHGAFTYFAIGALRGWADGQIDGQRDGTVTAEEAQLFVEQALQDHGFADQRPQIRATNSDTMPLAVVGEVAERNPFDLVAAVSREPVYEAVTETSDVGFSFDVAPGDSRVEQEIEARLDRRVDACDDFYRFTCGGWLDEATIPPESSRLSSFHEIGRRTQDSLQLIASGQVPGASQQLLDFYDVCLDNAAVEALGAKPVQPVLSRIDRLETPEDLVELMADIPGDVLLRSWVDVESGGGERGAFFIGQGGLGAASSVYGNTAARNKYELDVAALFRAAGDPSPARRAAEAVDVERALAVLFTREWPEPVALDRAALRKLTPTLRLDRLLDELGAPKEVPTHVVHPTFLQGVDGLVAERGVAALRPYLKARVLGTTASWLSSDFRDAWKGRGRIEQEREALCVGLADSSFADDLGRAFVARHFAGRSQEGMTTITAAVVDAIGRHLDRAEWLDGASRKAAHAKLAGLRQLVGTPDRWETVDVGVERGALFATLWRAHEANTRRSVSRIGTPGSAGWRMSAPTVNAYYDPSHNQLVFPAGILQPPFYDERRPQALNFGSIGAIMGHELSHGFDEKGSRFGADGGTSEGWSATTGKAFERLKTSLAGQYDGYEVLPGVSVNGQLTVGENLSDQAGVAFAASAYGYWAREHEPEPVMAGFTPEQQVFVGWAQGWCTLSTSDEAKRRARVDPHAPSEWRVNGTLRNLDAFWAAFECDAGTAMHAEEPVHVW